MRARFITMGESKQGGDIELAQANPNQDTTNADRKISKFEESFRNGLDDVVKVNRLLGSSVFIGLSFSSMPAALETREECKPGEGVAKWLVIFEITAFGFFILSTLLGKALKIQLYIPKKDPRIFQIACRVMMVVCAISTILGSFFLYLSLINVLQLRLGKLSCSGHVRIGAGALSALYFLALSCWIPSIVYAIKLASKVRL